jgi:glycosyltransferase involved in cell wall biosynthesis
MATVDILLPVKNGVAFLDEAIDSVRGQSFRDWRLLVLDYGSDDGSAELAQRHAGADARIGWHSLPNAVGLSGLLNDGLALCDSRYVMRIDADDVCFPNRIALTLAAFAGSPGIAVVGGQAEMIDRSGAHYGELRLPVGRLRISAGSFFRNPFSHPTLMMDRAAIDRLGARYGLDFLHALPESHSLRVDGLAEDYFMFGQLAMLGKCMNISARLIRCRWLGGNLSIARFREQMTLSLAISRFLARSFCAMHGLRAFDPAPFCNHGGRLFDMGRETDFDARFRAMETSLRRIHGDGDELLRELRFRRVLANRRLPNMLSRYLRFQRANAPETGEWYAVKSWLLRRLPGHACVPAHA